MFFGSEYRTRGGKFRMLSSSTFPSAFELPGRVAISNDLFANYSGKLDTKGSISRSAAI